MEPFEFDFCTRRPLPPVDRFVESIWYARGTVPYRREKIAPTGSTVAVLVLGDPILETPDNACGQSLEAEKGFILGPHDRPVINEPTGETYAVGIVTTPIGAEAVFGIRPVQLGLNLGETPTDDRVAEASGVCSHRVDLTQPRDVDEAVASWLRSAYESAG